MKVFISSVRRGLEEERDALPGLIRALGHEPVRFEDFTAQPVPSREACVAAVAASDICLLLLGAAYGQRMPDTGLSPTEEEFNAARNRGVPIYIFVKRGVSMDADQQTFVERVEQYATGRFRNAFDGVTDLQAAVVRVIRDHESAPPALTWETLTVSLPEPKWLSGDPHHRYPTSETIIEVHLTPVAAPSQLTAGELEALPDRLASQARHDGLFSQAAALDSGTDGNASWARAADHSPHGTSGIMVNRERVVTLWWPLPRDALGAVIDRDDLALVVASRLRMAAALGTISGPLTAIGVSLSNTAMVQEVSVSELGRRTSATIGWGSDEPLHLPAHDAVPTATLSHAADEIGREVATRLIHAFRQSRR